MLGDLFDKFVKDKTRYGWVFAVLGAIFVLAAIPLAQELLKRSVFSADARAQDAERFYRSGRSKHIAFLDLRAKGFPREAERLIAEAVDELKVAHKLNHACAPYLLYLIENRDTALTPQASMLRHEALQRGCDAASISKP